MVCLHDKNTVCASDAINQPCSTCEHRVNFTAGRKYDADKLRWDLLPTHLVEACVKVLTFGAKKYEPNNWQNVENGRDRYYAALMRHIVAWHNGEVVDPESGIEHLAHAMCNLVFLDWLDGQSAGLAL